jgi:Glycosyl transferase 4-like domain
MRTQTDNPAYDAATELRSLPLSRTNEGSYRLHSTPQSLRNVLFVTYYFPPNGEMGARTCAQIARYLPLHGWKPTIVTIDRDSIEKKFLESTDKLAEWGLADSVVRARPWLHPLDLYRVGKKLASALTQSRNQPATGEDAAAAFEIDNSAGLRGALLSMLSFPDLYTGWIAPAVLAGLRTIKQTNAEAVISSAPCWTSHLSAYLISRLSGLPWLAHYRDPLAVGLTMEKPLSAFETRLLARLETMVLAQANRVICVTEEHCALLRTSYPQFDEGKFLSVLNGFDGGDWEHLGDPPARRDNRFCITYAGSLYIKRNPTPVFRALRTLIDAGEMAPEDVRVELIGWCEVSEGRSVADQIEEAGLGEIVHLAGPRPHKETLQRLTQSDLLLLLAEELTTQIPGKTFEYLMAGRPILALTPEGSVARLLRQTGGAWAVESNNQAGILAAIRECYQAWKQGAPGRLPDPAVVRSFDRRQTTGRIAAELSAIASDRERK